MRPSSLRDFHVACSSARKLPCQPLSRKETLSPDNTQERMHVALGAKAGAALTHSNSDCTGLPAHASDMMCWCFQDSKASSPTRSTAGTPRFKSAKCVGMRQLSLGGPMHQSPAGIGQTRPAVAPASPASSMHSYRSTSELIESIQNRYLEAQSFLKSYKL